MIKKATTAITQLSVVTLMSVAAFIVIPKLDNWVGDWLGPLWVIGGFAAPYFLGIGAGILGWNFQSVWAGMISGLMVVLCPATIYFLTVRHIPTMEELLNLWIPFLILATVQGSLTLPVGARVRRRKKVKL